MGNSLDILKKLSEAHLFYSKTGVLSGLKEEALILHSRIVK